jgi:hypothetical protein
MHVAELIPALGQPQPVGNHSVVGVGGRAGQGMHVTARVVEEYGQDGGDRREHSNRGHGDFLLSRLLSLRAGTCQGKSAWTPGCPGKGLATL